MVNMPYHLYAVTNPEAKKVIYCGAKDEKDAHRWGDKVEQVGFQELRLRVGAIGANIILSTINENWRNVGDNVVFPESVFGLRVVERRLKETNA